MPAGRPTKYKIEYADQVYRYCLLGATDERLCQFFEVVHETLDSWKRRHPEFLASIKRGREEADARMAQSLWHRGMGYSHPAVKIFMTDNGPEIVPYTEHYPPDTNAASLWLRNRQPHLWRDKQEIEHTVKHVADELGDDELADIARGGRGDAIEAPQLPTKPNGVVH